MKKSRKNIKKNKRNSSRISKIKIYGGMKLNIQTHLEGIDVTLDVEPTDTIHSIKSKVIAKIGAQPNNFYKLTYNDVHLSDIKTIADYEIPENSNLMFRRHTPGLKLTEEERAEEHKKHKFGLCGSCDNGLDDDADWIVDKEVGFMCNACVAYYTEGETDGLVDDLLRTEYSIDLNVGTGCTNCDNIVNLGNEKIVKSRPILYKYPLQRFNTYKEFPIFP